MKINIGLLVILSVVVSFFSCSKENAVGTEIVQVEGVNIFSKTYPLISDARGEYEITPAYYAGLNESTHLLGSIDDPYLGKTESKLYFNYIPGEKFKYVGASFDSIVLSIKLDTANITGARSEYFDIEVRSLETNIYTIDTIYNDTDLLVNETIVGSKSGIINFDKGTSYYSDTADSVVTVAPQLRIKLDDQLGQSIMADSIIAEDTADFLAKYNGFEVTAKPTNSNMMSVFMDSGTNAGDNNSVEIYYTDSDGNKKVSYYDISNVNFNLFDVDHTGSPSLEQIDNGSKEFFYQQTMGGAYGELTLPDLSMLKNDSIAINSAVIEIEQAVLDNDLDSEVFPYLDGYFLTYMSMDTNEEEEIEDITNKASSSIGLIYHNGLLSDNKVEFNCTDQIKKYINGEADNKLFIKNLTTKSSASKAIFYGSANSDQSPKLKLTYTKI